MIFARLRNGHETWKPDGFRKKFQKKFKKVVDKMKATWYYE
jgi:hypothetical protein